jgi:hypothetical protein
LIRKHANEVLDDMYTQYHVEMNFAPDDSGKTAEDLLKLLVKAAQEAKFDPVHITVHTTNGSTFTQSPHGYPFNRRDRGIKETPLVEVVPAVPSAKTKRRKSYGVG